MAQVNLTINGRGYSVACDDGEEAHVSELAKFLDERVTTLAGQVGQVGEARLLVLTLLIIADELFEAKKAGGGGSNGADKLAQLVDLLTQRIDTIAGRLEKH